MTILKTFKKGHNKGFAHIIAYRRYTDQGWKTLKRVMVENCNGFTDYPIRYSDGTVAYDFPERFPTYVKQLAIKALDYLKTGEK